MEKANFIYIILLLFFKKGQVYTMQCFQWVDTLTYLLSFVAFFFSNETFIKEMVLYLTL